MCSKLTNGESKMGKTRTDLANVDGRDRCFKRFCVAEDRSVRADLVPAELPDSCRAIR